MKKQILIPLLILFSCQYMMSQEFLFGMRTKWDDTFAEWEIFADQEETGEITRRWRMSDNWREWDYRVGEQSGSIEQKWNNDPTLWELRGFDGVITMRTKWARDISEWRITDGTHTLTLVSKYKNNFEEWSIKEDSRYGKFEMFTVYERDVRDWEIEEELNEDISFDFKLAMAFIVIHFSTPRM